MKKKYFFYVLLVMVQIALLTSCISEHDLIDDVPENSLLINEAKAYFKWQMAQHEATVGDRELHGLATRFTPLWEGAVINGRDSMVSVDVPIVTDYLLRWVVPEEGPSGVEEFPILIAQKLIVVKNLHSGNIGAFIVSIIADKDYAESREKIDAMDFTHYGNYGNFSGRIIFSFPLSNVAMGVSRFRNGISTGSASVINLWDHPEEYRKESSEMTALLSGLRLQYKPRK